MTYKRAKDDQGLPAPIRLFLWVLVGLTLACVATEWVSGRIFHLGYPYDWPLMKLETRYFDFTLYRQRFTFFHSANFYVFNGPGYLYPAPVAVLYRLMYLLPGRVWGFLGSLLAVWFGLAFWLAMALRKRDLPWSHAVLAIGIAAVCSYPLWFEFEQANLEWVLCLLVAAGLVAFLRGHGYAAAVCFGIAGSMKIYPLAMIGLLLSRKQYKQAAASLVTCGTSTVAGLWLVCPDLKVSWHGTRIGLETFRQWYVLRYEQVGFDHSLFGLMKALSLAVLPAPLSMKALSLMVGLYLPVAAIAGILLYFDVIRKLPIVNQVICLTVATILLPPVSYDYTLLHLYLPWALVVLVALEQGAVRGAVAALACFAVLFAPETELIWNGRSYGGQVKALALVGLFGIALMRRFPSPWDRDPTIPPQTMQPDRADYVEVYGTQEQL